LENREPLVAVLFGFLWRPVRVCDNPVLVATEVPGLLALSDAFKEAKITSVMGTQEMAVKQSTHIPFQSVDCLTAISCVPMTDVIFASLKASDSASY
jgi:hypothetical protein